MRFALLTLLSLAMVSYALPSPLDRCGAECKNSAVQDRKNLIKEVNDAIEDGSVGASVIDLASQIVPVERS